MAHAAQSLSHGSMTKKAGCQGSRVYDQMGRRLGLRPMTLKAGSGAYDQA
jgi:hypothetical protein